MTYRVRGLDPALFKLLFGLSDAALAERRAMRVVADSPTGYPCRVSLQDAAEGEALILLSHVSLDVETPFRSEYAIYVREPADEAPVYQDALPAMLDRRTLSLRGFGADGLLKSARLAGPGEGDSGVRALLEQSEVAVVHAHNAAYSCFLAAIERN